VNINTKMHGEHKVKLLSGVKLEGDFWGHFLSKNKKCVLRTGGCVLVGVRMPIYMCVYCTVMLSAIINLENTMKKCIHLSDNSRKTSFTLILLIVLLTEGNILFCGGGG
jgi:hypothetical protein